MRYVKIEVCKGASTNLYPIVTQTQLCLAKVRYAMKTEMWKLSTNGYRKCSHRRNFVRKDDRMSWKHHYLKCVTHFSRTSMKAPPQTTIVSPIASPLKHNLATPHNKAIGIREMIHISTSGKLVCIYLNMEGKIVFITQTSSTMSLKCITNTLQNLLRYTCL